MPAFGSKLAWNLSEIMQSRRNKIHARDFHLDFMLSCLRQGEMDEAMTSLEEYLRISRENKQPVPEVLEDFPSWLKRREKIPRFALLVGINDLQTQFAHEDIKAWAACLEEHMGFKPANITRLEGEAASREKILKEFAKLIVQSRRFPTFLVFAGTGSIRGGDPPEFGILASDSIPAEGGEHQEIPLKLLAEMASGAKNLSTVLDAGWTLSMDRAYSIGSHNEEKISMDLPQIGNAMMVSAWKPNDGNKPELICKEDFGGSKFSQQLINLITEKSSILSTETILRQMKLGSINRISLGGVTYGPPLTFTR